MKRIKMCIYLQNLNLVLDKTKSAELIKLKSKGKQCFREVMVMENTNPFRGTCGTISWQLLEINMRLIIMWSVPFNFNIRDSYYAIGLTHNKVC